MDFTLDLFTLILLYNEDRLFNWNKMSSLNLNYKRNTYTTYLQFTIHILYSRPDNRQGQDTAEEGFLKTQNKKVNETPGATGQGY